MLRNLVILIAAFSPLTAADFDHPSGNRITPPTLDSVSPLGLARGTTTELTVEGLNLAKASAIYFSEAGVTGRILHVKELPDLSDVRLGSNGTPSTIDLGPLPPRNQVTLEVNVAATAEIGPVAFRLLTPLGTTPEAKVLIEPYYGECPATGKTPENAFECFLPGILTGTINTSGQTDFFKIQVKAGQQLVFQNGAAEIGSALTPVVTILSEDQSVVHEFGADGGMDSVQFGQRFEKPGTYYIRVADYKATGSKGNFYRIKVGHFPLVQSAYPLGIEAGKTREVTLAGWNLSAPKIHLTGKADPRFVDALALRPDHAFNEVRLAVGSEPEVDAGPNNHGAEQAVPVPVTINGILHQPDQYRFHAAKGKKYIVDVNARRLGSELDSFIEVLDAQGRPIERATVRALSETFTTLADKDSATAGLRISTWSDLHPGDLVMIGNEIIRIDRLPKGPDEDMFFENFGGQRLAFFDTTPEAHSIDKSVYKIRILPPGAKLSPNGLPLIHLYYQNDDGGPGWGKDSLVHFTAPADGDYIVRIRDVRGLAGDALPYRLTIREPRPDFRLNVANRNPNVPSGGCVAENVTALRLDDFDGPIDVNVEALPPVVHATPGVIHPGQTSTTVLLCAEPNAHLDAAVPLRITGRAGSLVREANPDDNLKLIALMPPPDVQMVAETQEIVLEQGGEAKVSVNIKRQNGFRGRVPIDVRNLPPHVLTSDVGLNGILLNEDETRRSFSLEALPDAPLGDQWIYVGGVVETRSPLPATYAAPAPIRLKIVARKN